MRHCVTTPQCRQAPASSILLFTSFMNPSLRYNSLAWVNLPHPMAATQTMFPLADPPASRLRLGRAIPSARTHSQVERVTPPGGPFSLRTPSRRRDSPCKSCRAAKSRPCRELLQRLRLESTGPSLSQSRGALQYE